MSDDLFPLGTSERIARACLLVVRIGCVSLVLLGAIALIVWWWRGETSAFATFWAAFCMVGLALRVWKDKEWQ